MSADGRLVDVSHVVESGMITYRGLPAPLVCDYLSRAASRKIYAPGTEFQIGKIEMIANTGTYVDSPFRTCRSCRSNGWPTCPRSSSARIFQRQGRFRGAH